MSELTARSRDTVRTDMDDAQTLGWLGTGRMGSAMARRLVDAGYDVTVWNRTRAKTADLSAAGARVADSLPDLGAADIVFTMVSTSRDLEDVVLGAQGLLARDRMPQVIVDCSTVGADTSARVRASADAAGVAFLAAPVSGNPHVVAGGEAIIVASGPHDTYERVRGCLDTIGRTSVWVGEAEQARLVKLCHNLYLGMIVQSLSEVTTLAEKSGVPRAAFLEFLNSTVLGTDWVRKRTPDLLSLDWTPTFTTELLRKDFDLGLAAARGEDVSMPLAASVLQLIQAAIGRGYRDSDFLSLFEVQANSSGLAVQPE
ncbi:NAD(P)-dependent oxidoreductase [Actinobacteria bacterium YIM 96077]|uniref:NAD(P)-dependent oxidoreductase n=1 Tax=Phytoactinopolyspora halophila TaxID=1981511 RepID=A0A329QZW6_9ACTN|nr:NAD(P)-dependent oxidoreductase [Phytoactinopolyspora halophila]AYY13339.1 NAD(P)-dependent oxidoreductase [Actinobacteria bacterium YIM 96077]RAW17426.1 NAD(P)-dependent oxidoreductase [Phytoactinopolyspora halophila]